MKTTTLFIKLMLSMTLALSATVGALEVGDQAPAFSLQATDGKTYSLEQFHDKQAIVIAWYPQAFTSGCTIECKSLAQNGHLLKRLDVTYFMASVDALEKNKAFAEENEADFPLLSYPSKEVATAYDVLAFYGMPKRHTFYIGKDGEKHVPVMLHRAIFGSLERFTGILIEHYSGKLPLWLAPLQLVIATISSNADDYAENVKKYCDNNGIRVTFDNRNEKINYKIREHSHAKVPIMFIIGDNEVNNNTVTIRRLGDNEQKELPFELAVNDLKKECRPPDIDNLS